MNTEELFESLQEIDDSLLERSESAGKKRRLSPFIQWGAAAACLVLIAAGGSYAVRHGFMGASQGGGTSQGGSSGEGITYMSYAGPVFPLSAAEADADITASRNIDFDFSPYETRTESYEETVNGKTETVSYTRFEAKSLVTDTYTLTNNSAADKEVTLLYPFAANLRSDLAEKPVITVDGSETGTKLHAGPYIGGFAPVWGDPEDTSTANLKDPDSWEVYRDQVEAGYEALAFDTQTIPDQPVTVYEVKDRYGEESKEVPAPTINLEFLMDPEKTTILSYGFNSGSFDDTTGACTRGTHVPQPYNPDYGESAYLIVLGEDVEDLKIQAYVNGACETPLENAGASLVRYETTLDQILAETAELFSEHTAAYLYGSDEVSILPTIGKEDFLSLAAELMMSRGLLAETPVDRYMDGMLEDIFSETAVQARILYLTFPVTVPAGGSVTVEAKMTKPASMDFIGENKERNGYDLVTALGSVLTFDRQTASVSNTDFIEIVSANMPFDLAAGITEVTLDLSEPHYYLEVKKKYEIETSSE